MDVGGRRIGVALSDPEGILAFPLKAIERTGGEAEFEAIAALVRENQVGRIIVGLPRSLSGVLGGQAQEIQGFCKRLAQEVDVPVETWDERLSTVEAQHRLVEAGVKGERGRRRRDAAAAAVILQAYLDRVQRASAQNSRADL